MSDERNPTSPFEEEAMETSMPDADVGAVAEEPEEMESEEEEEIIEEESGQVMEQPTMVTHQPIPAPTLPPPDYSSSLIAPPTTTTYTFDTVASTTIPEQTYQYQPEPSTQLSYQPELSSYHPEPSHAMETEEEEEKEEAKSDFIPTTTTTIADAYSSHVPSFASSTTSTISPSRSELVHHLRQLIRPFGPIDFPLSTTIEPSLVPLPSASLYPNSQPPIPKPNDRKRNASHPPGEEATMTAEEFYHAVKDLKALPLVRVGKYSSLEYQPQQVAEPVLRRIDTIQQVAELDDHLNDVNTLGHIRAVEQYFSLDSYEPGNESHRRLWLQHEYFDPYRLLTHPYPSPIAHPSDLVAETARYESFQPLLAAGSPIPLKLRNLSFASSHVATSLAELETLHGIITRPDQRARDAIAAAAAKPPVDIFQTFIDLSGCEGGGSEYLLWKRRAVNLRGRGWGYDLTGSPAKENWSKQWKNEVSKEQSKNFNCFFPPYDHSKPALEQLISEQPLDAFQRQIDAQTKGRGVDLAMAINYASADRTTHVPSLSYRPSSSSMYPILLFQVDTALRCLAKGGSFILQLYETHTPFTLSLVYILFQLFDHCILQQLGGSIGFGSGQCILLCKSYHHDRLAIRPSAFPLIDAFRQIKEKLHPLTQASQSWSSHSLIEPKLLRINPEFVQWIQKYNQMSVLLRDQRPNFPLQIFFSSDFSYDCLLIVFLRSHAYQLHSLLTLLQPTTLQPSGLLNETDSTDSSSITHMQQLPKPIYPLPPPHYRISISMLQYTGFPVQDSFVRVAGERR